jgi:hypothetical protein
MMQGKRFHRLATVVSWSLFAFGAVPVVAAKPSKENARQAQSGKATEEETKRNTFREEMQSMSPADRRKFEWGIGMLLNQLMYPGLQDLDRAMKMFQKDIGAEPTGEITEEQLQELGERAERVKIPEIYFPTLFSSTDVELMRKNGFASVRGTAVLLADDESIAFPVNNVNITCYKSEQYCELRESYLALFPIKGSGYTWSFDERTFLFKITSWSDDSIEAKEADDPVAVRSSSLSLNFKTKEFFWITKNSGNDTNLITGKQFPPLKKPRMAQLVNGDKIVADYFKKLKNEASSFWSSEFKKKAEVLFTEK